MVLNAASVTNLDENAGMKDSALQNHENNHKLNTISIYHLWVVVKESIDILFIISSPTLNKWFISSVSQWENTHYSFYSIKEELHWRIEEERYGTSSWYSQYMYLREE